MNIQLNYKKYFTFICIVYLVVFFVSCRQAEEISSPVDGKIKVKSIFNIKNNELAQKIIHLSYDWKFKKANKAIIKLRENKDDQLLADLLDVGNCFWRYIGAMTPEHNKFAKEEYSRSVKKVKISTAAALKANSNDLKALFLLGFTEGSQAKFYAIEAEWFKAYRYGVKGYGRLLKIQRINKHDYDSQFGIGIYKYYCATFLPKWFQKISWMVPGIDVDRKGGYDRIVIASQFASVIKVEAQLSLGQSDAHYERKYLRSKILLEKLYDEYPHNKVVQYSLAATCFYYGDHLRYFGKLKESNKEFKESLSIGSDKPGFRMVLRKKNYLMPSMKWTMVAHSDIEILFSTYLEMSRNYFYMNNIKKATDCLEDGADEDHMPKMLQAALYFEIARQRRILGLEDYKKYIDKASKLAGPHSDISRHCRAFLSSKYRLPHLEKIMHQINQGIFLTKIGLKEVVEYYSKYKSTHYRYQFYKILSHLYQIDDQPNKSEKYDDLYRVHRQAER